MVDDGRTRRLEQHARRPGFADLLGYLQARCDTGHSIPLLAQELDESESTITQALTTLALSAGSCCV